jgi:hypothetical protein
VPCSADIVWREQVGTPIHHAGKHARREYLDRDETVVIKCGRDRDYDRDRKMVIIDRER